ncbi:Aspartic proteinase-like protein 2 [Nymphaea thermarum]|nr:Aspartic proteinase-like protein 2 [Nymphaea thermarum]
MELKLKEVSSKGSDKGRSVLEIVDLHGPCSPFSATGGEPGHDDGQAFKMVINGDQSRVEWINSIMSSSPPQSKTVQDLRQTNSMTDVPVYGGDSLGTGNFIVKVDLGTPKRQFSLAMDTGSSLSWVQCEPCLLSCYLQKGIRFAPSASVTYKSIPCVSAKCDELKLVFGDGGCSESQVCLYSVEYADNSYSVGFFGQDTLTLTANDVFPQFSFGCGFRNHGLFGMTGGMLGLGRGNLSVVSQTAGKFGRIFAYCLPTGSESGSLAFGADKSYDSVQFTPLLDDDRPFYFVNVVGVSVGGRPLPISSSIFVNSGTIIDSGTVITRLPAKAYSELRAAVRSAMAKYRIAPPYSILDTCYDLSSYVNVEYPTIAFHFRGGTNLVLKDVNIFVAPSGGASQMCLAFAANSKEGDVAIIGNCQQKRNLVVYDIDNSRIGFKAGACS